MPSIAPSVAGAATPESVATSAVVNRISIAVYPAVPVARMHRSPEAAASRGRGGVKGAFRGLATPDGAIRRDAGSDGAEARLARRLLFVFGLDRGDRQLRLELEEVLLSDAADVHHVLDLLERSILLPVLDDARGGLGADAGEPFELGGGRGIQVDHRRRRRLRGRRRGCLALRDEGRGLQHREQRERGEWEHGSEHVGPPFRERTLAALAMAGEEVGPTGYRWMARVTPPEARRGPVRSARRRRGNWMRRRWMWRSARLTSARRLREPAKDDAAR